MVEVDEAVGRYVEAEVEVVHTYVEDVDAVDEAAGTYVEAEVEVDEAIGR